jgi:hypothetical protein
MGNKFGMEGNLNNASRPLRHNGATSCSLLLIMSIIPRSAPSSRLWPVTAKLHKAQSASVLLAWRGGDEIKSQWLVTFLANDWHLAACRETTLRVPHHHTADRRRHISFPARWCVVSACRTIQCYHLNYTPLSTFALVWSQKKTYFKAKLVSNRGGQAEATIKCTTMHSADRPTARVTDSYLSIIL